MKTQNFDARDALLEMTGLIGLESDPGVFTRAASRRRQVHVYSYSSNFFTS